MTIRLSNAGKRFNRDWVFKGVTYSFSAGETYAITGANGSGKSTLLQVLAGSLGVSKGEIAWDLGKKVVDSNDVFKFLAIAAPYIEVIEEMTAVEFLAFHQQFKPLTGGVTIPQILSIIGLDKAANKQIRYYSSGMKQRVKLAQAVFSAAPLLLLDEPCTNLDAAGFDLYRRLINDFAGHKTIIVSSNDINEYSFCRNVINIMEYK